MKLASVPDRFEVLEELVASETEVLLRAKDRLLLREVLIKKPGPGIAGSLRKRDAREQALREARALARVSHPGVVRLLEVMDVEDGPLLVLEPVEGEVLAERLWREGKMEPDEVAGMGRGLAAALEAVHAAGVVHRGLGPENVVLRADGSPCLTGFNFVKAGFYLGESTRGTTLVYNRSTQTWSGEKRPALPPHPAPEQLRGEKADERSDLFGLGWVLYESLTGARPFEEEDSVRWKKPGDPRKAVPGTPRALARALVRCLAPSPAQRFASAGELRAALEEAAPRDGAAGSASGAGGRAFPRLAVGAGAAAAVLVAGLFALRSVFPAGNHPTEAQERGLAVAESPRAGTFAPAYARSHALLFGIGAAYGERGFPPLPNAERDVEALAARIAELGGEGDEGADGNGWEITKLLGEACDRRTLLEELGSLAERTQPDDRVFLYYAGHGEAHPRAPKSGWIVPADARPLDEDPGRSSWLRFDELFHFFQEARAKHVLVAMDCCYGGRLTTYRSASAAAFRDAFLTEKAHVVIASGRPSERVSDGLPGESSPFARAFLDALSPQEAGGPLTSSMLYARIQRSFLERGIEHTPVLAHPEGARSQGEFVFFVE